MGGGLRDLLQKCPLRELVVSKHYRLGVATATRLVEWERVHGVHG